MVDYGSIASALEALKNTFGMLKALISLREEQITKGRVNEVMGALSEALSFAYEAQAENFTLQDRIREFEKRIAEMEKWESEREKYRLEEVASSVYAYTLKEGADGLAPVHKICAQCYERAVKSILQQETRFPGAEEVLVCHNCNLELYVNGGRTVTTSPLKRKR